jgi:hypothetical protein
MERYEKIVALEGEVQAEVVSSALTGQGIPHRVRSYHDSALDGVLQGTYGWGHLEAPVEFKERILDIVRNIEPTAAQPDGKPTTEGSTP